MSTAPSGDRTRAAMKRVGAALVPPGFFTQIAYEKSHSHILSALRCYKGWLRSNGYRRSIENQTI
jgi:hypothetical protein